MDCDGNTYRTGGTYGLCQECGFKFRMSELRKRWDGFMVCKEDWEPRHPQEFVRGKADRIRYNGPISPEPADSFTMDTLRDGENDLITDGLGLPIVIDEGISLEDL